MEPPRQLGMLPEAIAVAADVDDVTVSVRPCLRPVTVPSARTRSRSIRLPANGTWRRTTAIEVQRERHRVHEFKALVRCPLSGQVPPGDSVRLRLSESTICRRYRRSLKKSPVSAKIPGF